METKTKKFKKTKLVMNYTIFLMTMECIFEAMKLDLRVCQCDIQIKSLEHYQAHAHVTIPNGTFNIHINSGGYIRITGMEMYLPLAEIKRYIYELHNKKSIQLPVYQIDTYLKPTDTVPVTRYFVGNSIGDYLNAVQANATKRKMYRFKVIPLNC